MDSAGVTAFTRAVEISRSAGDPDAYEPMWDLLHEAASDGPSAGVFALDRLTSTDVGVRAAACDLLGIVAEFHDDQRPGAVRVLLAAMEVEKDSSVVWSLTRALGRTRDPIVLPGLLTAAAHGAPDVRREAAVALTSVMCDEPDDVGVGALIGLTRDTDPEVRNWATFGLGWQLPVDGPAIRAALWERTRDGYRDAREEGIRGLARRRDARVVPLIADLLSGADAHVFTFDAAAFLASEDLIRYLVNYDIVDQGVAEALRECDPANRQRRDDLAWALFTAVNDARPDLPIALYSERFEIGLVLAVEPIGEPPIAVWSVERLLDRAGDDPVRAAVLVTNGF